MSCKRWGRLPRCFFEKDCGKILHCSLHGFADASLKGYSAVINVVYKTATGWHSQLICSKTLKKLTIPRLELMSARILATLMDTVQTVLSPHIVIEDKFYWLDSKTALYWIYNAKDWKQFVQHRVNEILSLSVKSHWIHCLGLENPAD